jgi:hypothetical protein
MRQMRSGPESRWSPTESPWFTWQKIRLQTPCTLNDAQGCANESAQASAHAPHATPYVYVVSHM